MVDKYWIDCFITKSKANKDDIKIDCAFRLGDNDTQEISYNGNDIVEGVNRITAEIQDKIASYKKPETIEEQNARLRKENDELKIELDKLRAISLEVSEKKAPNNSSKTNSNDDTIESILNTVNSDEFKKNYEKYYSDCLDNLLKAMFK